VVAFKFNSPSDTILTSDAPIGRLPPIGQSKRDPNPAESGNQLVCHQRSHSHEGWLPAPILWLRSTTRLKSDGYPAFVCKDCEASRKFSSLSWLVGSTGAYALADGGAYLVVELLKYAIHSGSTVLCAVIDNQICIASSVILQL